MLTLYRSAEGEGASELAERAERVCERLGCEIVRLSPDEIVIPEGRRRDEREESLARLAESIRRHGVLQPIAVCRTEEGETRLILGERRLRAARLLGLTSLPCVCLEAEPRESAELFLSSSLGERHPSAFEEGEAILRMLAEEGAPPSALARRLSLAPRQVRERLSLAAASPALRRAVLASGLTERHLFALLRLPGESERETVLAYLAERGLSAEATEALIERLLSGGERESDRRRIRGAVGDLRLFFNSVDRAVSAARRAGLRVASERREEGEETVVILRIARDC